MPAAKGLQRLVQKGSAVKGEENEASCLEPSHAGQNPTAEPLHHTHVAAHVSSHQQRISPSNNRRTMPALDVVKARDWKGGTPVRARMGNAAETDTDDDSSLEEGLHKGRGKGAGRAVLTRRNLFATMASRGSRGGGTEEEEGQSAKKKWRRE
jgi:hypothetical protein